MTRQSAVLITGASSGIGRAIAEKLSIERKLILHGRDKDRLNDVHAGLGGDPHLKFLFDLAADGVATQLSRFLEETQVSVDCFIHCAGEVVVLPTRSLNEPIVSRTFRVNCISALEIVATLLKRSINGSALRNILFISSIWSRTGARGHVVYCSSKAALDGAMRALAVELAPVIRVNSLLLGAVKTPMSKSVFENSDFAERISKDYPLGPGEPDDVAELVAFVISDKAKWITGQELTIDGGRTVNASHG